MSKRYGNDICWCFKEDGWETNRPIEIWLNIGMGHEEVIAHATDKFYAMQIVDAMISSANSGTDDEHTLTKKELAFLDFVSNQCPEPWSTMAMNAIMWKDKETYRTLKAKFNEIY